MKRTLGLGGAILLALLPACAERSEGVFATNELPVALERARTMNTLVVADFAIDN